jgi:hypothetical protein
MAEGKFEDTEGVIRSHKTKKRQYNGQKKDNRKHGALIHVPSKWTLVYFFALHN